jgi:hypothetical protein
VSTPTPPVAPGQRWRCTKDPDRIVEVVSVDHRVARAVVRTVWRDGAPRAGRRSTIQLDHRGRPPGYRPAGIEESERS